ncbi:MAG: hypothetical protein C4288_12005 [Leptolyngbya sp. ERB_1_1]
MHIIVMFTRYLIKCGNEEHGVFNTRGLARHNAFRLARELSWQKPAIKVHNNQTGKVVFEIKPGSSEIVTDILE